MSKVSRRDLIASGAGLLPVFGLAGLALAQQTGTNALTGANQQKSDQDANTDAANPQGKSYDPPMAACLLIMGRKQIEICRFALEKIQHDAVKQFAQAEIEEHETIKRRLSELGYTYPAAAGSREGDAGRTLGGLLGRDTGGTVSVGRATLPGPVSDLISIDHEIADQCIQTVRTELGKLEGRDFDKRFVGNQLDAHYSLLDHGTVYRKYASREMAPVLEEARPIIERHIATCKELMDTLDKQQKQGQ